MVMEIKNQSEKPSCCWSHQYCSSIASILCEVTSNTQLKDLVTYKICHYCSVTGLMHTRDCSNTNNIQVSVRMRCNNNH